MPGEVNPTPAPSTLPAVPAPAPELHAPVPPRRVPLWLATTVGGVLGTAVGVPSGMVASHVADGSSPLPLRTFDWILDHGVPGLALALAFVLGWLLLRAYAARSVTEREWRASERKWMEERSDLEREYRVKVEGLVREQVPIAERTRRALEQNTVVLRSLHLIDEDPSDAEDDGEGGA